MSETVLRKGKTYNAKQLIALLGRRYGLNALGIKTLLKIDGKRLNEVKGGSNITLEEGQTIVELFGELEGRFEHECY